MKHSTDTRKPYTGTTRSLVVALDVGTTFSGVSYAILEPGEIPKIHGVTRFPGQEHIAGNSKIPTIMYYDHTGRMMAAGAEADTSSVLSQAEDEGWIKVELFKLRLRPRTMKLNMNGMKLGPLPYQKTAVHVFGDFLGYLFRCTRNFIRDTHANGASLWRAVEHDIQFVLSHPNGWEGVQQTKMRRSAVYGGLIPDTNEGKARIRFVTEGEASLHACVLNGLAADVLSGPSKSGFLVADAGGGTLDISSYTILAQHPLVIEEIAPPDCIFAGSVFVSRRARELFQEKLKNSRYGTPDAVEHITKRFDETTKRLFRDKKDPQFIPFGSPLDKDLSVGIRSGQLKLSGAEVAELFEPSIQAAVAAIKAQIDASHGMIKSVFLVGGYAASAWLFSQLQERLGAFNVSVSRPDTQTSKAVADGAIGFYCDHHVSARMSKFMYGVEYLRQYNAEDPEHVQRKDRLCELPSGPRLLPDAFDCILARGVKVKESTVFTRKYCTELTSLSLLSVFEVEIWCYRGGNTIPKWIHRQAEDFSTLCLVRADLSPLSGSAEPKTGKHGRVYWNIVFSVEIHFGLTEFRARIKWVDNGTTKYGPASIIYNERGHRLEEDDEPDGIPEDDMTTPAHSRAGSRMPESQSRARSRDSFHTPAMTASNSKRSSMFGHSTNGQGAEVTPNHDIPRENGHSLSRTPTESSRNGHVRDPSRGRSTYKGKEKAQSPPVTDSDGASMSTRTSSRLADTLSSVWGAVASPAKSAKSVAESLRSKDVTPLPSPVKRELKEILGSPIPPATTASTHIPHRNDTTEMPGAFNTEQPVPEIQDNYPAPIMETNSVLPAQDIEFLKDSSAAANALTGNALTQNASALRVETAFTNDPPLFSGREPSAVISPISLPDFPAAVSNAQTIVETGLSPDNLLSLSNDSDLLAPPASERISENTNSLSDLLSSKSPKGLSPIAASSPKAWGSSKVPSPKPAGSPSAEAAHTGGSPWGAARGLGGTSKPASPLAETAPSGGSPWGASRGLGGTSKPASPLAETAPSGGSPWGSSRGIGGTPKPAGSPLAESAQTSGSPWASTRGPAGASKAGTPKSTATPKKGTTPISASTPAPSSPPKADSSLPPPTESEDKEKEKTPAASPKPSPKATTAAGSPKTSTLPDPEPEATSDPTPSQGAAETTETTVPSTNEPTGETAVEAAPEVGGGATNDATGETAVGAAPEVSGGATNDTTQEPAAEGDSLGWGTSTEVDNGWGTAAAPTVDAKDEQTTPTGEATTEDANNPAETAAAADVTAETPAPEAPEAEGGGKEEGDAEEKDADDAPTTKETTGGKGSNKKKDNKTKNKKKKK